MRLRSFALGAVMLAILPFGLGCEQSVQDADEDVQDAQMEAEQDVAEEQADVERARLEGQQDVQEEQRDLQEAQESEAQGAAEPGAPGAGTP